MFGVGLVTPFVVSVVALVREGERIEDVERRQRERKKYRRYLHVDDVRSAPGKGKRVAIKLSLRNSGDRAMERLVVSIEFHNRTPTWKTPNDPVKVVEFSPLGRNEHLPPRTTIEVSHEVRPPKDWDGESLAARVVEFEWGRDGDPVIG